jgi:calcineurin-like phosphoesterase family protein
LTVFFTSDLHVNHAFVATLRGFGTDREDADIAAHDEAIADGWADTVRSKDQVWVLGDIIGNPG